MNSYIDKIGKLDFNNSEPYKIKTIAFINHSFTPKSVWKKADQGQLLNIFKAIASSGLKDSLATINLYSNKPNCYSPKFALKIAKEAGLDEKLIVFENWYK